MSVPRKIFRKLLDRMAFSATTDPIDPENRVRRPVGFEVEGLAHQFELWGHELPDDPPGDKPRWVILKFPGTGGRAERTTVHPAGFFSDRSVAGVWAVNPPGYGGSEGRPALATMPAVIDAAVESVRSADPTARLLVTGNSLGCLWALYASAHCGADAMLLRNPFPLKELIAGRWRYNWWNLGAARFLAGGIPHELDAISNARKCLQPAMVVQSGSDSLIPPRFQDLVISALAGPCEMLAVQGADHGDPVPEELHEVYRRRFESVIASS